VDSRAHVKQATQDLVAAAVLTIVSCTLVLQRQRVSTDTCPTRVLVQLGSPGNSAKANLMSAQRTHVSTAELAFSMELDQMLDVFARQVGPEHFVLMT
jgi:hypothetical protein